MKGARDIVSFVKQCQDIACYQETGLVGSNTEYWPKCVSGTLFCEAKASAQTRNIQFLLDEGTYNRLCFQTCTYCGRAPSPMHGIDRIDSGGHYEEKNCTTSCSACNIGKKDHNREDFIQCCQLISQRVSNILDYRIGFLPRNT